MKPKIPDTTRTIHNPEPDYTRPLLKLPRKSFNRMYNRLRVLYSESVARATMLELERILTVFWAHKPRKLMIHI
jgi:sucrose phosphorylase